jgi:hypothetical protein
MTIKPPPLSHLASGIRDGAIIVQGRSYRLPYVLYAYERLIDALTREFGGKSIFLITGKESYGWHTRAREDLLKYVRTVAKHYQVCTQFHTHLFDGVRARAFLLGTDLCCAIQEHRIYRTSRGKPLNELQGEPRIVFFGDGKPARFAGEFPAEPTVPYSVTDRIASVVLSDELAMYGFRFERGPIAVSPGGKLCQDCLVAFPYDVYGAGENEFMSVRCLGPDGKSVKPLKPGRN